MLKRNKLSKSQIQELPERIRRFGVESQVPYKLNDFVCHTITKIRMGIEQAISHDIWINDDLYCLGVMDTDPDGKRVYTAYQLFISPAKRGQVSIPRLVQFLRFYAEKHKAERFYIVSSRLDNIQAYQRGIGYSFKPTFVTFCEELN